MLDLFCLKRRNKTWLKGLLTYTMSTEQKHSKRNSEKLCFYRYAHICNIKKINTFGAFKYITHRMKDTKYHPQNWEPFNFLGDFYFRLKLVLVTKGIGKKR